MDYARLAIVLPKFLEQEMRSRNGYGSHMTINDFRLGIRRQRLTEIRDWSNDDLDVMEAHAARFDDNAPLNCVLEVPD